MKKIKAYFREAKNSWTIWLSVALAVAGQADLTPVKEFLDVWMPAISSNVITTIGLLAAFSRSRSLIKAAIADKPLEDK